MWTNLIELGLVGAKRLLARLEQRLGVGPSLCNIDAKVLTLGVSTKGENLRGRYKEAGGKLGGGQRRDWKGKAERGRTRWH